MAKVPNKLTEVIGKAKEGPNVMDVSGNFPLSDNRDLAWVRLNAFFGHYVTEERKFFLKEFALSKFKEVSVLLKAT